MPTPRAGTNVEGQQYQFSPDAETAFRDYLERRMQQSPFANARSMHNALERARLRHASRIVSRRGRKVGKADLLCIQAEGILKSRVFEDQTTSVSASPLDCP